ncbi:MAG: 30S ribosomal protein S9 [Thermodesulfobacteriota bacterium]
MQENIIYATGKRKSAIARTWLKPGNGKITVNGRTADEYFPIFAVQKLLRSPLTFTENADKFDIDVRVTGGGITGQASAARHAISRALTIFQADLRQPLKAAGFLKRDARVKERKKYGQRGPRARYQFSKR